MTSETISMIGVGDIHFERPDGTSMFRHVQPYLDQADVRFANSEQMYSPLGSPTRRHATYSHVDGPSVVAQVGFDVLSFANNHTLDWGPDSLLDTLIKTEAAGVRCVGAGETITLARQPVIIERKSIKLGFLAYSCTGPVEYAAEDDKPGYAPVHAVTTYEQVDYQPGTPPRIRSAPDAEHVVAMCEDISALRERCDAVVVSFHWGLHFVPAVIPEYCKIVGRIAARAGASLVLGTHAHMLKGVEVVDGVPIFYGTGNFALEMGVDSSGDIGLTEILGWLTKHYGYELDPDYPTFPMHPDSKYTLMVEADFSADGLTECRIIPCLINRQAEPEVVRANTEDAETVVGYLERITAAEGLNATFTWIDDTRLVVRPQGEQSRG